MVRRREREIRRDVGRGRGRIDRSDGEREGGTDIEREREGGREGIDGDVFD